MAELIWVKKIEIVLWPKLPFSFLYSFVLI